MAFDDFWNEEIQQDDDARASADELYLAFRKWDDEWNRGWKLSRVRFGMKLREKGVKKTKVSGRVVYVGIRIRPKRKEI